MMRVEFNPQLVLRRVRRPASQDLIEHAHNAVFKMLRAPRSRIWKYPGLMHRYATPDVERSLVQSEEATTFFVSRRWSRCCLILLTLRSKQTAILFHKENNRLEIVNHNEERIPGIAFNGTVVDGYLSVSEGGVVFHPVDPIRYAGRWLGSSTSLEQRRRQVSDLCGPGSASVLAIQWITPQSGVAPAPDDEKISLVYAKDRRGLYRAHALCFRPAGGANEGAALEDDRYTVGDEDEFEEFIA